VKKSLNEWVKWLQVRIPELKKGANEYWVKQALEGYHKEVEKEKNIELNITGLSNEIDLNKLSKLLKYSDKYEISIQFWPDQIAVYISKDGVDLNDYGGGFDFAVSKSIEYLERLTGNKELNI